MRNIRKYFKNPNRFFLLFASKGFFKNMSDEKYLKRMFRVLFGYELDLDNPKTYNEKIQWLKLNDRNPLYTKLVDKYLVREYVSRVVGNDYLIPLFGVWNSAKEIDFDSLPEKFVLKCNHDCGGLYICKDKTALSKKDISNIRKRMNKCQKKNYYHLNREWPYKNVQKKIIAEDYLVDESGYELKDYKFFCFNGEVKALYVASDRGSKGEETKFDFFDTNFNHLPIINGHPNSKKEIKKPKNFETMIEISKKLSAGFPHVRVDLYNVDGKIFFGELTFYHWSGFVPFEPQEWDQTFGDYIDLDLVKTQDYEKN